MLRAMSKNSFLILTVGLAALILVIGATGLKRETDLNNYAVGGGPPEVIESPTQTTTTSAVIVVYLTAGYEPVIVTIRKGETVSWINRSEEMMQVASDPHPTHDFYPGFDQLYGVGQGQTYTFTFDKPGIWNYYNHLNYYK